MTMPGGHGGGWMTLRSYSRDRSESRSKLAPDTLPRIIAFAKPYRRWLAILLTLIVIDAAVGAFVPLIYREIVIAMQRHHVGAVSALAGLLAGLALFDAAISL